MSIHFRAVLADYLTKKLEYFHATVGSKSTIDISVLRNNNNNSASTDCSRTSISLGSLEDEILNVISVGRGEDEVI